MIKVEKVDAYLTSSDTIVASVKKIEAYETSRGELFCTFEQAAKAQAHIDLDELMGRDNVGRYETWDADTFSDWMLANARELGEILTQASRSS